MTEPMPEPTDHLPTTRRGALQALAKDFEDLAAQGLEGMATKAAVGVIVLTAETYPVEDTSITLVRYDDGSVSIDWPYGRGPVIVAPDVVEGWVSRVNELLVEAQLRSNQVSAVKAHYQRRTETLTATRDSARSEADRLRADLVSALGRQDDLSEGLRQQKLRQQLAEREVTDLRAEVERLRGLVGEAIDAGASNDGDAIARIRREAGLT